MKFIKDLLLINIERTGPNPERDHMIQLSAVLLDKDNLLEKQVFNSYIKASFLDGKIAEHATHLGIEFEKVQKSPKLTEVIKSFDAAFGKDALLTTHGFENITFLKNAYKKVMIPFDFDKHILDIWSLGYIYTLHYGIKKIPSFSTLIDHFNLKQDNPHNALEKVRHNATILKNIIGKS